MVTLGYAHAWGDTDAQQHWRLRANNRILPFTCTAGCDSQALDRAGYFMLGIENAHKCPHGLRFMARRTLLYIFPSAPNILNLIYEAQSHSYGAALSVYVSDIKENTVFVLLAA